MKGEGQILTSDVLMGELEQIKLGGVTSIDVHNAKLLRIIAAALINLIRVGVEE
jgi:hypothetical protein